MRYTINAECLSDAIQFCRQSQINKGIETNRLKKLIRLQRENQTFDEPELELVMIYSCLYDSYVVVKWCIDEFIEIASKHDSNTNLSHLLYALYGLAGEHNSKKVKSVIMDFLDNECLD
jgi:hypothetical protein